MRTAGGAYSYPPTLTGHVSPSKACCSKSLERTLNTGITITGALIAILLSIIGYLLVHPVGLR